MPLLSDEVLTLPILIYHEEGKVWARSLQFDLKTSGVSRDEALLQMEEVLLDRVRAQARALGNTPLHGYVDDASLWKRFARAQLNYIDGEFKGDDVRTRKVDTVAYIYFDIDVYFDDFIDGMADEEGVPDEKEAVVNSLLALTRPR